MDILINVISYTTLVLLIFLPIILAKLTVKLHLKSKYIIGRSALIILSLILLIFSAWWSDFSSQILLTQYNYNFDGMNETENFKNVKKIDIQKVAELKKSLMGIGWPLKAIMIFPFYLTYSGFAFFITTRITKNKILKTV